MAITNVAKPVSSMTNSSKQDGGETWAHITTSWASETRTWLGTGSLIGNVAKQTSSMTNIAKPA